MAAAPVESCRFVKRCSLGSPRVGAIHVQSPTPLRPPLPAFLVDSLSSPRPFEHELLGNGFQSSESTRLSHRWRMRYRRLPTTRPTSRRPGADLPPKKVCNLDPMAPVPVKNVNYPRAPSSRRSGLVGPHTTPAIVNYKYMTSTLSRRVLLAAHARDVNILIWTSRKSVDHGTNDRVMVHGDGTRADGRRSGPRAESSQMVGLRVGRAPSILRSINPM